MAGTLFMVYNYWLTFIFLFISFIPYNNSNTHFETFYTLVYFLNALFKNELVNKKPGF